MGDRVNYNKISKYETEGDDLPVAPPVPKENDIPTHKVMRVVKCKRLNVRQRPTKDSEVICVVEEGFNLSVNIKANEGVTPGWVRVRADADKVGYVMEEFVKEV